MGMRVRVQRAVTANTGTRWWFLDTIRQSSSEATDDRQGEIRDSNPFLDHELVLGELNFQGRTLGLSLTPELFLVIKIRTSYY